MYAKLFIKTAIVVLVINVALIGLITDQFAWLAVAAGNLIALFVLLFQERTVFQTSPPSTQRILFTSDVFAWISLGVGVIFAGIGERICPVMPSLIRWVLATGIFYLLSVAVFGLVPHFWRSSCVRVVSAVVILVGWAVLLLQTGRVTWQWVVHRYDRIVDWWQGRLQSVVIDESIPLPQEGGVVPPTLQEIVGEEDTDALFASWGDELVPSDTPSVDVENNVEASTRLFSAQITTQQGELTFWTFLPVLFETLAIPPSTNTYTFTNVSTTSPLYPSFVLARDYAMIGTATQPTTPITCQTLMILLGLAQRRDLTYTSSTVFDTFWSEAQARGYTATCSDRTAIATWAMLP